MDYENSYTATRIGGYTAIGGGVTMLMGALLNTLAVGSDASGQMNRLVIVNLILWIIGVLLLGSAGMVMANLSIQKTTQRSEQAVESSRLTGMETTLS